MFGVSPNWPPSRFASLTDLPRVAGEVFSFGPLSRLRGRVREGASGSREDRVCEVSVAPSRFASLTDLPRIAGEEFSFGSLSHRAYPVPSPVLSLVLSYQVLR